MTIELGVFLPTMSTGVGPPPDTTAAAVRAEQLGFGSVWAVDQLVAGTGVPIVDSFVALSAAAGATSTIEIGLGVVIVPLRPVAWIAKQVASLQHVSGGRVLFGVGVGGDRHDLSWAASGVPKRQRGARTDAALAVLPDLIAGKPAALPDIVGNPVVQLAPGTRVPPIVVGGGGDRALQRAARFGGAWLALPVPPADAASSVERLRELADDAGRPQPEVIGSVMVALDGDPTLPGHAELVRQVSDPDGLFGIPAEHVPTMVVTGGRDALVARLAGWEELGARRVVVSVAAGDWHRQAELVAGR